MSSTTSSELQHLRTVTITGKGQVVIPQEMRKSAFKEGKRVVIMAFDDRIEIRALDDVAGFLAEKGRIAPLMSASSSLAKRWNTPQEDEAWKHL
ncbi:TPA: AbrB/MazE/SpoVT family DNA-binding domain-containing protein [Candidatus Woesearchaeota archaeon]|nr:AbrB/MazE/SpoVT family DNA-binding domain-containing protein [Candidatus Woesearchaeota archaeon]